MRRLLFPHLAVWLIGGTLLRVAVVPPEVCPPVSAGELRAAIVAAGDWIARSVDGNGVYAYGYDRDQDEVPAEFSQVRHAGAVFTLYQMANAGFTGVAAAAEAGLDHMLRHLIDHDDWTAYAEGQASVGANGLLLVALHERRLLTGDTGYDGLMRRIGRFIADQQEPRGSIVRHWSPVTGRPVPGDYGIFATGEALWGITLLDDLFPDEGWEEIARRTARYLALERDQAEGEVTMYPDHWAAYAMAQLGDDGLDPDLVRYARRLAGFFSVRIRVESQRTGKGINFLVRGYPGPPSGLATSGEGMAALWRLAGLEPGIADMRPGMAADLRCMAGMAVQRQVGPAQAATYARPHLADGAWFYRDYSQIDDQQHTIAALLAILPVFEEEEG